MLVRVSECVLENQEVARLAVSVFVCLSVFAFAARQNEQTVSVSRLCVVRSLWLLSVFVPLSLSLSLLVCV